MPRACDNPGADLDECPDYLTVDDVAALLRIGRHAVYDAVKRGQIPAIKIGRALRIPRERLRAVLDGLTQ